MKLYSKIKYRHKVAGVIFLFILLPFLILSMFIVKKSWDEKVDTIIEHNRSELRIGVEAINTMFLTGLEKLSFINGNSAFSAYLEKGEFTDLVKNMAVYYELKKTVEVLVANSAEIGFVIYPFSQDVYNGAYVEKMERLESRLGNEAQEILVGLRQLEWDDRMWRYEEEKKSAYAFNKLGFLYCYKKMQILNKNLAVTEMHISMSKILERIKGDFPEGSRIIYKPDDHSELSVVKEYGQDASGQSWIVVPDTSELLAGEYYPIEVALNNNPGKFTLLLPQSYILTELPGFLLTSVLLVVFSIILLFLIVELASFLITKRLTRLIDRVTMSIENTKEVSETGRRSMEDDLGRLEDKFYDMLAKIREFYKSMLEHENEKKTFELELLQSRVNPHFLYNTLSTMKWNCKNEKMAGIIDSMVLYYRLALNKGDSVVKISQELKLVEEYLKIQQYTYESDFTYRIEVDDDVKELPTVRHLLQPVVENAVLHGINGLESGGRIKIEGKLKGGIITITVSDNGVGMTEETVNKLLDGEYKGKMGGYGIKNVQRRISLFYGPESAFKMESSPGTGTKVIFTLAAAYREKLFTVSNAGDVKVLPM